MKRTRVVIVTPGTFEPLSGRSSSVERVVRETCSRTADSVESYVIGKSVRGRPHREVRDGVTYIRVPYRSAAGYIRRVAGWVRRLRPDVVQVENRPRFARALKRRFPRTPVWLGLHSLTFVAKPNITRREAARCMRRADRIIANSRYLQGELARIAPKASPRIVVNHLGVDTERFASRWEPEQAAERERRLEELGWAGRRVLLYAGRLLPIKGVHKLLEAMPEIVERHPEALLVVIGSARYGSDRVTPYVARLHRMGDKLRGHVRFVPYVAHEELPAWYRLADLAVMPSSEREAFGLVAVEAMASGVPVLATRAGGLAEVVSHGESGLLLAPKRLRREIAEAAGRLLDDPQLARRMGEAAERRARERFAWERSAARWAELVREARG